LDQSILARVADAQLDLDESDNPAVAGAWSQTPNVVAPKSAAELWDTIGKIVLDSGSGTQWVFRGVSNAQWRVRSSLVRRFVEEYGRLPTELDLRLHETRLYNRAKDWFPEVDPFAVVDQTAVLALMQHHGIPTRLLDVTSNPITALWMACRVGPPGRDRSSDSKEGPHETLVERLPAGVLIAFRVSGLAVSDTRRAHGLYLQADMRRISWKNSLTASFERAEPFLVRPANPDRRMTAQEGLFLTSAAPSAPRVDSEQRTPLDCIFPPSTPLQAVATRLSQGGANIMFGDVLTGFDVVPVIIRPKVREALLPALARTFNRTERSMFPDLAGMATSLGERPLLSISEAGFARPYNKLDPPLGASMETWWADNPDDLD
jgi:hypothetical protein